MCRSFIYFDLLHYFLSVNFHALAVPNDYMVGQKWQKEIHRDGKRERERERERERKKKKKNMIMMMIKIKMLLLLMMMMMMMTTTIIWWWYWSMTWLRYEYTCQVECIEFWTENEIKWMNGITGKGTRPRWTAFNLVGSSQWPILFYFPSTGNRLK